MTSDPDHDELDGLAAWAGPPRGVHRPEDDWHEDETTPPDGPAGVSAAEENTEADQEP